MFGVAPPDPQVAHLRSELDRFKNENAKLVRQLNAERKRVSDLEHENGLLERELIQVKTPDARADLASMLDELKGER